MVRQFWYIASSVMKIVLLLKYFAFLCLSRAVCLWPVLPAAVAADNTSWIRLLPGGLDENQVLAQNLAVMAEPVLHYVRDPATGQPLRAEVFGVDPVSGDEAGAGHPDCPASDCYRVAIYDWARNATVSVWVDVPKQRIVAVRRLVDSSPELPEHLVQRAIALAQADSRVQEALAAAGQRNAAPGMAQVRTSLNRTACELSRHLCVAPTFELGDKALWAIVDLTDEQVVGVQWTDLGDFDADLPTESNLVKHTIYRDYCRGPVSLKRGLWQLDYQLTASDGLRISSVFFNGQPLLKDVRLVDYHVSYSNKAGFGYNDAIGCPLFSSAAVAAFSPPAIRTLATTSQPNTQPPAPANPPDSASGFEIVQDFRHPLWPKPCNYRYQQRYRFYANGDFSIEAANLGRGCGAHAVYRFLFRIQPADVPGQQWLKQESAAGMVYRPVKQEYWQAWPATPQHATDTPPWRWQTAAFQYGLEPVFDPMEDARAYVYLVRHHAAEGDSNMPTLGACCNLDHRQGPESLIDSPPESIVDGRWVLWYVPVIENNPAPGQERCWADTRVINGFYQTRVWPCWAGLRFRRGARPDKNILSAGSKITDKQPTGGSNPENDNR